MPREPGRKESRWRDLLQATGISDEDASRVADVMNPGNEPEPPPSLATRVAVLEAEVTRLTARLDGLDAGAGH